MISRQSTADRDEIDLIAIIQLFWDSKYIIVLITALFGLGAVILALTATPIYRAEVVIVEAGERDMGSAATLASQFGGLANLAGVNLSAGNVGREAQAILTSRHLVEEFIERNELVTELSPAEGEPPTLWMAVKRFRETVITIREDATEGITTVSMEWTDPITAARWANGFVALANELIRARALDEATRNIEYLYQQIERTNVVEVQRVMYNLIERETKTLMLANARAEYAFRVVDPAVAPEMRNRPKRRLMVLSGLVLGMFAGIISVLVYNLVRRLRA